GPSYRTSARVLTGGGAGGSAEGCTTTTLESSHTSRQSLTRTAPVAGHERHRGMDGTRHGREGRAPVTARSAASAGAGRGGRGCLVTVCRGCCCGTERKHPGIDHDGLLAALAEVGAVRVSDCLDVCEDSNVVVVQPSADPPAPPPVRTLAEVR
ncbi:MAG: hypothetical protein JWO79_4917, partial [Actinomycetia bacterium]|nr:hypothetical protein [Actinomycetes bacterium]